jgi:hypothetical protein
VVMLPWVGFLGTGDDLSWIHNALHKDWSSITWTVFNK